MREYLGLDVSKEDTSFCVKGDKGGIVAWGKTASDPAALFASLKEHAPDAERIVVGTGPLFNWLCRELGCRRSASMPARCMR